MSLGLAFALLQAAFKLACDLRRTRTAMYVLEALMRLDKLDNYGACAIMEGVHAVTATADWIACMVSSRHFTCLAMPQVGMFDLCLTCCKCENHYCFLLCHTARILLKARWCDWRTIQG